jgi:hypothetical protein
MLSRAGLWPRCSAVRRHFGAIARQCGSRPILVKKPLDSAFGIGFSLAESSNTGRIDLGRVALDDQEADLRAVGSDVISCSRLQVTAGQDMTSGVA